MTLDRPIDFFRPAPSPPGNRALSKVNEEIARRSHQRGDDVQTAWYRMLNHKLGSDH
jgi:hypothetical protein